MKRRGWGLIGLILLGILYSRVWYYLPSRELPVLVVDKTVPETDYREHIGLFWLLEQYRYTSGGRFLDGTRDYLGYHPPVRGREEKKETLGPGDLAGKGFLYLADAYGIYDYAQEYREYEDRLPREHQPVSLLYGGLDAGEVEAISAFARQGQVTLVGEFNIFSYPTYLDPGASTRLQDLFGVKHTGWTGKYYSDLGEAAFILKELYQVIYGTEYDFRGEGLLLVRDDFPAWEWYPDILVLTARDMVSPFPRVYAGEHVYTEGVTERGVPYHYWLEILEPQPGAEVFASFHLELREEGQEKLAAKGLPGVFPAAVRYRPPGEGERVYFAGDFVDQVVPGWASRLAGSAGLLKAASYLPGMPGEFVFFWRWYSPVMQNILGEAARRYQP